MTRLPALKPLDVVRAFEKMGYRKHRQKGSHLIMVNDKNPYCQPMIPIHAKNLKKGTLRAIIRQAGLTVDQFLDFLK